MISSISSCTFRSVLWHYGYHDFCFASFCTFEDSGNIQMFGFLRLDRKHGFLQLPVVWFVNVVVLICLGRGVGHSALWMEYPCESTIFMSFSCEWSDTIMGRHIVQVRVKDFFVFLHVCFFQDVVIDVTHSRACRFDDEHYRCSRPCGRRFVASESESLGNVIGIRFGLVSEFFFFGKCCQVYGSFSRQFTELYRHIASSFQPFFFGWHSRGERRGKLLVCQMWIFFWLRRWYRSICWFPTQTVRWFPTQSVKSEKHQRRRWRRHQVSISKTDVPVLSRSQSIFVSQNHNNRCWGS